MQTLSNTTSRRICMLSITCIVIGQRPSFLCCIRQVLTQRNLDWVSTLIELTKYERLLGQEQRCFTSRTRPSCTVTDDPPFRRLIIGKEETRAHLWPLWKRRTKWRVALKLGASSYCIVGFRLGLKNIGASESFETFDKSNSELNVKRLDWLFQFSRGHSLPLHTQHRSAAHPQYRWAYQKMDC